MQAGPSADADLESVLQRAIRHHQVGQVAEAERLYRTVLQRRPDHPGVNNALGIALKQLNRLADAAAAFEHAIAAAPDFVPAQTNLGNILFEQGRLAEAEARYRQVLALQPDSVDTLKNLGLVLVEGGRFAESFPWFRRHAELAYGRPPSAPLAESVPSHKLRHDQEQRAYLGADNGGAAPFFRLEDGGRVTGRAVNADTLNGEIAARWQTATPQIAVIDNLLTEEALDRLRHYCWRSTMWHQVYANGYVGAMPEHGFACPLLAQVVDELRETYPAILGQYPLLRWWTFKYNSKLAGINIHADFAAVNVNIWITPDEANLAPGTGGLIIWDKPAPLDWSFDDYNAGRSGQAIRDFLSRSGAQAVTVPYRANRAVVFDSDLFHQGDAISFKDGYLNARINITMLFGRREAAGA